MYNWGHFQYWLCLLWHIVIIPPPGDDLIDQTWRECVCENRIVLMIKVTVRTVFGISYSKTTTCHLWRLIRTFICSSCYVATKLSAWRCPIDIAYVIIISTWSSLFIAINPVIDTYHEDVEMVILQGIPSIKLRTT